MDTNYTRMTAEDVNSMTERRLLGKVIELLIDKKLTTEDLQFKYNKEREEDTSDDRWFNYVEKDGWIFQRHKLGKRIRLINPSNIRVAKAPKKDDFVKQCRKLLIEKFW